jgi:hypothetical protein
MLKRLALVALASVALASGLVGCDSNSHDTHRGHDNMPGMKQ